MHTLALRQRQHGSKSQLLENTPCDQGLLSKPTTSITQNQKKPQNDTCDRQDKEQDQQKKQKRSSNLNHTEQQSTYLRQSIMISA